MSSANRWALSGAKIGTPNGRHRWAARFADGRDGYLLERANFEEEPLWWIEPLADEPFAAGYVEALPFHGHGFPYGYTVEPPS